MSEENIALRLKFLIENLSLTSSQFADKCGISRSTLSQLLSGRNKKLSNLIIEQIHAAYPGLSVLWLLFGEGEMWSSNSVAANDSNASENLGTALETDVSASSAKSNSADLPLMGDEADVSTRNKQKNPCENRESCTVDSAAREYSKETGVNRSQNSYVNSNNEIVNPELCSAEILAQLGKIKEKSRKVVQITVYYDDSTFQTFYPNK